MIFDDWDQLATPGIRPATPSDVRTIARLHVDGWKSTYADVLPERVLKRLNYADRERTWMRLIAGGDSGPYVLVAEYPGEGIVGFIAAGPERSELPEYSTEAYALYVEKGYQQKGIGRALLQYVAQIMSENGQQGLLAWTFAESPTNGFFQQMGAEVVSSRTREFNETPIEETAYGWPDIRRLLEDEPEEFSDPDDDDSDSQDSDGEKA